MPKHDYSPRDALNLLLKKVEESSHGLAERIRTAIDSGKDVQVQDDTSWGHRGRKAPRYYRKNQPYADQEALRVALSVLQSHLVETRMFVISASTEFKATRIAPPETLWEGKEVHKVTEIMPRGEKVIIEIEVEPETVLTKKEPENQVLKTVPESELRSLRALFDKLQELTNFGEEDHGYPS